LDALTRINNQLSKLKCHHDKLPVRNGSSVTERMEGDRLLQQDGRSVVAIGFGVEGAIASRLQLAND